MHIIDHTTKLSCLPSQYWESQTGFFVVLSPLKQKSPMEIAELANDQLTEIFSKMIFQPLTRWEYFLLFGQPKFCVRLP